MINNWDKGGSSFPQVGQPDPQIYCSRSVGSQMNSQTFWNGAGVSPALTASYSRRNIAFPQTNQENMQYNCMNTHFPTVGWGGEAAGAAYPTPTSETSVPDMAHRIPTQSAAVSQTQMPPPQPAVIPPQPAPLPQGGAGYSRRNLPAPGTMPDLTHERAAFKLDPANNKWAKELSNSKGKVRVQELTEGFMIPRFSKVLSEEMELRYVIIESVIHGRQYSCIMSADDYLHERYHRYLNNIVRYPSCTKSLFNELVGFIMKQAQMQEIILYSHAGWHEFPNGEIIYAYEPKNSYLPHKLLSKGVKLYKLLIPLHSPDMIISNWKKAVQSDGRLTFCGMYRCSSRLKYFMSQADVHKAKIPILAPSEHCKEESLTAINSTRDISEVPVTNLIDGEKAVIEEQGYNCDGVSLYVDHSFADESKKVIDGLKAILRGAERGRSLPAVISQNAALTAMKLAPNVFLPIDTTGITVEKTPEELQIIFAEMDTLIVTTAQNQANEVKRLFAEKASVFRDALSKDVQGEALETLVMFCLTGIFFTRFLGFDFLNSEMLKHLIPVVTSPPQKILSVDEAIVRELVAVLSELIRTKKYVVMRKKNNMKFTDDGHTLILDGNRLYLSSALLEDIMGYLQKVHSIESVIKALKRLGYLICTDFDTHPIELYDAEGQHQRLYLHDVLADILDADVVYQLYNPEIAAFLHTGDEVPQSGFIPIITDGNGHIAGRLVDFHAAENDNVAIYGQAGEGKSYTKAQIMARRFVQGYDILDFDKSASDTYEALCMNLSKEFVDQNVVFHKLDSAEINVDIFNIDRTASLPSQKKEMIGIITAAVAELSVPQTNLLRSAISDLLEVTDKNQPILPDDLLELLNEDGITYESLRSRLGPFFEDIKEYKLTNGTWKDIFSGERKIHVVQINEKYSSNGNQIIDALLAGLFNYKCENPQRPLSVVIDEVQNHNLSVSGPIRKILKEGRKYRLSIIASTQDFYARSTEIGSALGKADMQIHHRPTQDSANLVATELRWKKADMVRFDSMNRGDVIIKGALYNKEQKRNVQTTISGHIVDFHADEHDGSHNNN